MQFFIDNGPWCWLVLTILFTVIEVFTMGLTTIWFAAGAFVMVFVSFTRIPFAAQIAIFLAVSGALLVITRPLAVKKFKAGRTKTNVDSLIGKDALVVKKITEFEQGEIKVNGQIWSARAEDASIVIEENTKCRIVRIEGVHAIVLPL
jgi:membrane protein implicated in regulation of membrane protease activity